MSVLINNYKLNEFAQWLKQKQKIKFVALLSWRQKEASGKLHRGVIFFSVCFSSTTNDVLQVSVGIA